MNEPTTRLGRAEVEPEDLRVPDACAESDEPSLPDRSVGPPPSGALVVCVAVWFSSVLDTACTAGSSWAPELV